MNQKVQEIKTGLKEVDSLFKGLKQSSIIVIDGNPIVSSAFLFNLIANLCAYKKKCLFCATNFWNKEVLRVFAHIESYMYDNYKVTLEDIHTFDISTIELPLMEDKIKKLNPDFVFIDTTGVLEVSPCKEYIPQFIEEMAKKYNVCFFINTSGKEYDISDMVSTDLIELANEIIIASGERCSENINIESTKRLNKSITLPYGTSVLKYLF